LVVTVKLKEPVEVDSAGYFNLNPQQLHLNIFTMDKAGFRKGLKAEN